MALTNEQRRGVAIQHIKFLTDDDLIYEIKKRGYRVTGISIKQLNDIKSSVENLKSKDITDPKDMDKYVEKIISDFKKTKEKLKEQHKISE